MSIFKKKYPKGVWKDEKGILRYSDYMVYITESDTKNKELPNDKVVKELLKPIYIKAEAFECIKVISSNIILPVQKIVKT